MITEPELYFIYRATEGLRQKGLDKKPEYRQRLQYELQVILGMKYSGYFLIVDDFIKWCRNNDIYIGPGRGSGAGSLVCYVLDITRLDPIQYGLIFERFLNPSRVSMPDLDIDIEPRYRGRVINYLKQRYGYDKVAHISTFNNRRAKGAVKDTARVLGYPPMLGDTISKLLLPPIHGKPQKLATSIEKVPELRSFVLKPTCSEATILEWAQKLEDLIVSSGVHASGIVISNTPLTDVVPLFLSNDGEIVTQWSMDDIETIGLIKFDILGLDALSKIHDCVDIVKQTKDKHLDIYTLPLNDLDTYAALRSGDSIGLFQLESSSGIKELEIQIRPENLEDISALVAIYRPGPLGSDYKDTYLKVRSGEIQAEYLVPELEPILRPTGGWVIYQESCMRIATDLCGYTMAEADDFRKAIGKKKKDLMDLHEPKFKQGWINSGYPAEKADILWDSLVSFAAYAFNKSHSAVYALITYITAYLKTHYTTEFMQAIMSSEGATHDDMIQFIGECKRLNIEVLPPDVNQSKLLFSSSSERAIRFGLSAIKNVGEGARQLIVERDNYGSFTSFENFLTRTSSHLNKGKIESLILAGAFDSFGHTRKSLLDMVSSFIDYKKDLVSHASKMETYHKRLEAYNARLIEINNGSKKKPLKLPMLPPSVSYPSIQPQPELSRLEIQKAEHDLVGLYITSHPLDGLPSAVYTGCMPDISSLQHVSNYKVAIVGVIVSKKEITTKAKDKMATYVIEDTTGTIEAVFFPKTYQKFKDVLQPAIPIIVRGILDVTETEDGEIRRLKAWEVITLDSVLQSESYALLGTQKKIQITLPSDRAHEVIKMIKTYIGGNDSLDIMIRTHDGTHYSYGSLKVKNIDKIMTHIGILSA